MLIEFAKYTLVLCAIIFFGNNRTCTNELNEAGEGIYWRASCTAKCLVREGDRKFKECRDRCQSDKLSEANFPKPKKINENHDLIQVCRDDHSITLKVVLPAQKLSTTPSIFNSNHLHQQSAVQYSRYLSTTISPANSTISPRSSTDVREIYVINVSLSREPVEMSVYLSNDNFITIDNLIQNTSYNISVVVVYSSDEYSIIAKGRQFTTLRRGYKPKEIPEISLLKFDADETDEMRVTALIVWSPSHDMTCHYDLICYSPEREDMEVTPIEIRNPQSLYTYVLSNLTFDTVYNVGIRAKNTNDSSKESDLAWKKIKTPSCIEWHHNNFNICAPLTPEGLSVEEHYLAANEFSLNISWQHPKFEPDYYTLRILDLDQLHTHEVKSYIVNATKDQNWVFIPKLSLTGMIYEAHLTAYTLGGSSTAVKTLPTKIRLFISDKNYVLKLITAILAPIFCIAILSLMVFIICHRRAKLKRYQERCKYFEELEKKAPIDPKSTFDFPTKTLSVPPSQDDLHQFQLDLEEKLFFNDDMEINRNDIKLYEVLGEGAFGLVRRGIFLSSKQQQNNTREVAVKMLKDQPSVDDVRAFRREIEVMKSVGYHPNIVGIIGHCTRKYNEMLLLTEYCSFGNLLNFLRNEWKYLHELSFRGTADDLSIPSESALPSHPLSATGGLHKLSSENVFNFDSTIVEKIKMRYKNINSASSNGSTAYVGNPRIAETKPGRPHNLTEYNKSYGYDEICTNACKHRVDIVTNGSASQTDGTKAAPPRCGQIKISNKCDCKLKRIKILSIDNEGYYKNVTTLNAPAGSEAKPIDKLAKDEDVVNASIPTKREPLKSSDLLDIAKQVAMGMEFLSKNKVVHRDLAARNVLVSSDRTVKIADFGLSRDVYQENVYKKTGCGKLPIKWLALESMTHQVYTSQSDVWSYGILLYEIATLGGIPYPSIPTNRLLHLLKTGYRMERPKNCGHEFYKLMSSCWHFNPAERPTFTNIIKIVDCLLNETPELHIKQLILTKQNSRSCSISSPESPKSDDSYLKPL